MRSSTISNIEELQAEVARLKVLDREQTIEIKKPLSSPKAIFMTLGSLFQTPDEQNKTPVPGSFYPDLLRLASRFAIPFALNKTIFRNSNFLIKMIVDLVSQKAAGQVSEAGAQKLFSQAKSLFNNLLSKVMPQVSNKQMRSTNKMIK